MINKHKKILIDQPGFIGDIIFVMAIAQKYVNDGFHVDFPVFDEHIETSIQKYFPTVNIFPLSKFSNYSRYDSSVNIIDDDDYYCLPLRASAIREPYQHMKNKYEILGFSYEMWRDLVISRDYDAENKLFDELGLKEGDKYNLINENHQPTFIKIPIHVNNEYKNIYMNKIGKFTMFDWIGIMEKAQSIHTIGTSLILIIDAMTITPEELHIYSRLDKGHNTYNYLLKKTYIYH